MLVPKVIIQIAEVVLWNKEAFKRNMILNIIKLEIRIICHLVSHYKMIP